MDLVKDEPGDEMDDIDPMNFVKTEICENDEVLNVENYDNCDSNVETHIIRQNGIPDISDFCRVEVDSNFKLAFKPGKCPSLKNGISNADDSTNLILKNILIQSDQEKDRLRNTIDTDTGSSDDSISMIVRDEDYVKSKNADLGEYEHGLIKNTARINTVTGTSTRRRRSANKSRTKNKSDQTRNNKKKPLECDVCKKQYQFISQLTIHRRTHTGEKPFNCQQCGRKFAESSTLIRHRRTHTGEKPYRCDLCDKAFSQNSTLHAHRRTHAGDASVPFTCNQCNEAFPYSADLLEHIQLHKAEKLLLAIPENSIQKIDLPCSRQNSSKDE